MNHAIAANNSIFEILLLFNLGKLLLITVMWELIAIRHVKNKHYLIVVNHACIAVIMDSKSGLEKI